LTDVKD